MPSSRSGQAIVVGQLKVGDTVLGNYAQLSTDGTISLVGTAKYERHIQIPATPSGTVAQQMDSETYGTAIGLQASSSIDQYAGCQWEVPDDWDGTDVYFEIDWLPNSGAMSGTDTVQWIIEYRAIAEGEVITLGTVKTLTSTNSDDLSQGQTKHSRVTLPYNDANQPLTKQDHVYFLVHRNVAVANDFSGTAFVTAYEIIYTSNGFPTSN